jgi:hypothetical protein
MDAHRKPFDGTDLLTKFEQEFLREPYRAYYIAKRNNFFASVDGFKDLWNCFILANEIWMASPHRRHSPPRTRHGRQLRGGESAHLCMAA